MNEIASSVKMIKVKNISSISNDLIKLNVSPENYQDVLSAGFSRGHYNGRMIVKGLLKAVPSFKDRHQILMSVRQKEQPELRREVVRSYKESRNDLEMVTSLSLMTTKDAKPFFKDYFDVGGKLKTITKWLANISEIYIEEKRKGNINPEYDGFWGDLWDGIVDAGKAIGEAISTVVDAVVEAGKSFGEIVDDIIDYAQRRINNIIEALIDAGKDIADFLIDILDKGVEFVTKVFKAIVAAGKDVLDIIKWLYDNAVDFLKDGIKILIDIGTRIKDILKSAADLAINTLKEVVGHLVDLGHSVWYILKWAASKTVEVISGVFEKLLEIGKTLGDLVAWCIRRSFELMKKGFQVLIAMGNTFFTIVKTIITDPENLLSKSFEALKELGATAYDFLKAGAEFGVDFIEKVYDTLKKIGMMLIDILEFAVTQGISIFKEIAIWLLQTGVKVFDILLWALQKSVQVFTWVLEAADAVFDTFLDIVEWIFSIGGDWLGHLAGWLAEKARAAVDWFTEKVILPILAVGKLILVIALALTNIVFLAIAFFVLNSLVDEDKTDYKHWPETLAGFKNTFSNKLAILHEVDASHKYVIVSDVHKESNEDIDAGLGHFHKNKTLFKNVLNHYAQDDSWTLVTVGDAEEFWYCDDLSIEENPVQKVVPIIDSNSDVYGIISDEFYKFKNPRQFIKIRGNHDDVWSNSTAVNKLKNKGFPNIDVYDYAIIRRNGAEILIMHGQQFDPYNCDANNFFGKFASNFVGESIDQLNDTLVSIFGDGARIEGWSLAPFFTKAEWISDSMGNVEEPEISDGVMFSELPIVDQMRKYNVSMICGHTHGPKVMKDSQNQDRYYINSGTSGWWEDCIWTIEITQEDVTLIAWTSDQMPFRTFKFSEATSF